VTRRIALIPARGGSVRIPGKNIRSFLGVPILERVIATVLESGVVDDCVVSTDSEQIAAVAVAAGAEVPFLRPAELSDSYTGARPVIQHAVRSLGLDGETCVGVIYPTAVLTTVSDIQQSLALLDDGSVDFVMSVTEFTAPVQRALVMRDDGILRPMYPDNLLARSQDLEKSFHDIGQFYWGTARTWMTSVPVAQARCKPFVVEPWRAVDIDTPADWERAEQVFRMLYDKP